MGVDVEGAGGGEGRLGVGATRLGVPEELEGGAGHGGGIAGGEQTSVDAVPHDFGEASDAGGEDGAAGGEGFDGGEAQALAAGGGEHEVGGGEEAGEILSLPGEYGAGFETVFAYGALEGGAAFAFSDDQEGGVGMGGGDMDKGFQDGVGVFGGVEATDGEEEGAFRGEVELAPDGRSVGSRGRGERNAVAEGQKFGRG